MSINKNRQKLNKAENNNIYQRIWLGELYPMYYDEGLNFYQRYRRGFKCSNKRIANYKRRMYRTWKHNRNKQYKNDTRSKGI